MVGQSVQQVRRTSPNILRVLTSPTSQFVFAVINTSPSNQTVDISLIDVFVDQGRSFGSGTFTLYDLWQKDADGKWGLSIGDHSGSVSVDVASHQTKVYKAIPVSSASKKRAASEL